MPKIKAATVAAHREEQRAVLLGAARDAILEGGVAALTFGSLAERARMSRPSVYEYFPTKPQLLIALIEAEAPVWRDQVLEAVSHASSAEESLQLFVRIILKLVRNGRHELPFALAAADLDESVRHAVSKAHENLFSIVAPALEKLGVSDPSRCAELVGGAIHAASDRLRRQRRDGMIVEQTTAFVVGGVRALARKT